MRPDIEKFFARYGAALSSDDVPGIVSCFDPPTVVIDDAATTLMIDHAHEEAYFTGMAERYRARGALSAAATLRGVEQLAPALWLVDVRWDSLMRLVHRHLSVSRPTGTLCAPSNPTSH